MNWYKKSQSENYVPEHIEEGYPPEYVDIGHPYVKDKKEMEYWGDVYLWIYNFGGNIKTYKLDEKTRTHGQLEELAGNFDIWGRFSTKQKIASMSFYNNPNPFSIIDVALQLEEIIGRDYKIYVSGSVGGKQFNETLPSIEYFVKQITPKSMKVAQYQDRSYKDRNEYPMSYLDIGHPDDYTPEEEWKGDIVLWSYLMGKFYTYELSDSAEGHGSNENIPWKINEERAINGRISKSRKLTHMAVPPGIAKEKLVDALLHLQETFGDIDVIINDTIENDRVNGEYPVNYWIKRFSKSIKLAQTTQELYQQYADLQNSHSVNITGTGQSETIQLPGGQTINAGDLLRQALNTIQHILIQNGVKEVNTDPLYNNPQAQGLAISNEPGKVYVDIKKIVDGAKGSLPPVAQLDGVGLDPDISNNIVQEISQYILAEIGETLTHESFHAQQYNDALQQGNPFTSVQEAPAEQFGQQMRQQYFGN